MNMYEEEIKKLQEIIDDSERIVFLEGQVCLQKAEYLTSEALTVFIISNINTLRSRS